MRTSMLIPLVFVWMVATISCDSARTAGPAGTGGTTASGGAAATGGAIGSGGATGSGGESGQGGQGGAADDIATIMATYQTWEPRTAAPVDISAMIFALCRAPSAAEDRFVDSAHSRFAVRDWLNPGAVAGLTAKGVGGYPVGAAIVKEKFATPTPGAALELAALGMMVKRAPGFDENAGDWEFVYWNAANGVSRGAMQLPACAACHADAKVTDFVFANTNWRVPATN